MFKIPDWETDIPKNHVDFLNHISKKKVKVSNNNEYSEVQNKKNKNEDKNRKRTANQKNISIKNSNKADLNSIEKNMTNRSGIIKNKRNKNVSNKDKKLQNIGRTMKNKQEKQNPMNEKEKSINGQSNNFTQKPKNTLMKKEVAVKESQQFLGREETTRKRKTNGNFVNEHNDSCFTINVKDLDFEKADELILNAKKKKLNDEHKKEDREEELFPRENKNKLSFKKQKIKQMLQKTEANRNSIRVNGTDLRTRMLERLKAAQFRYLNEKLYTSTGSEAKELFQSDPSAFATYHQGYQLQVKKWPVNPLDVIVKRIMRMPKSHMIADMGCGEGALARRVPHNVRSFDLVATNPSVEVCDMAQAPLLTASVDVAVYCLALMGTELTQYLVEANRILKMGGHLLIAEVESRFDNVESFTQDVEKLGFKLKNLDKTHKVFYFMQFVKVREPPAKKSKRPMLSLKPCLYKKR